MMYRRILTSLSVVLVILAVAVPAASARYLPQELVHQQLGQIPGWAVSPTRQSGPTLASQRALSSERLREVGAWAAPTTGQTPSTLASQRALVPERLREIGAWAVPSSSTVLVRPGVAAQEAITRGQREELQGLGAIPSKPTARATAGSDGFDWNKAGLGAAFVLGAVLLGVASLATRRRYHRPVTH